MNHYQLTTAEQQYCEQALQKLAQVKGVVSCVTASPDGFTVAKAGELNLETDRLAAMSSSATAVAYALINELKFSDLNAQIIDASGGKVVVMSLPTPKQNMTLLCTCKADALIGQVLYAAKTAAKEIIEYFNPD